jgi:hypothetical protein
MFGLRMELVRPFRTCRSGRRPIPLLCAGWLGVLTAADQGTPSSTKRPHNVQGSIIHAGSTRIGLRDIGVAPGRLLPLGIAPEMPIKCAGTVIRYRAADNEANANRSSLCVNIRISSFTRPRSRSLTLQGGLHELLYMYIPNALFSLKKTDPGPFGNNCLASPWRSSETDRSKSAKNFRDVSPPLIHTKGGVSTSSEIIIDTSRATLRPEYRSHT